MDLRLVPLALSSWISAALVLALATHVDPTYALVLFVIVCALALSLVKRSFSHGLAFSLLGIALGSACALLRVLPIITGPLHALADERAVAHLTGVITSDPISFERAGALDWTSTQSVVVALRVESVEARSTRVRCRLPVSAFAHGEAALTLAHLVPGTRVQLTGRLAPTTPGRNSAATVTVMDVSAITGPPRYQFAANYLRQSLRRLLADSPRDARQLVPGLALGDSSGTTMSLTTAMRNAGLSHLTAVSGANVSLVIVGVGALLRRRSRRVQAIGSLIALLIFVVLVRPQPSVLRAAAMGLVGVYSAVSRFRVSALPALSVAVLSLIVIDPWLATSYGFALSVIATAGLVLWAHNVTAALSRIMSKRVPSWFIDVLAMTLCAQLAVLPLTVALGSQVTLASLPANMIAVPLAAPAMIFGMLAAVVSPVCFPVAHVLAFGAIIPARAIAWIARWAAASDSLVLAWPTGIHGVLLAMGLIVLLAHAAYWWRRVPDLTQSLIASTDTDISGTHSDNSSHHANASATQSVIASTVLSLLALLWIHPDVSVRPWPPANWIMVSCDVGQGDATVLRLANESAIVIDVGPEPKAIDRCLSDLHIRSISMLVLTHFHADHVGGIAGALHRRTVGQVWVSPLEEPDLTASFVAEQFAERKIRQHVLTYPSRLHIGDYDIECVWPARIIRDQGSDPNNASIVLVVHIHGHSHLLSGDVEPPAQEAIVAAVVPLSVDVIKVAHHGSPHQSVGFAQAAHAHDAIISVGANNDYGHPAQSTIALYENLGARVWRTDQAGDIAVTETAAGLKVVSR